MFWIEDATSGSREARDQRRDRYVTSDATEVWSRRDSEWRLKRAWRHVPQRSTGLRSRKRAADSERQQLQCGERQRPGLLVRRRDCRDPTRGDVTGRDRERGAPP
jgi:hypothetical protein